MLHLLPIGCLRKPASRSQLALHKFYCSRWGNQCSPKRRRIFGPWAESSDLRRLGTPQSRLLASSVPTSNWTQIREIVHLTGRPRRPEQLPVSILEKV